MPLEDVVSPVIAAFLAGRKMKLEQEKTVRDKQAAEDESKIRQQQAQKLAKEVAHFDKQAELEDQQKQISVALARNNMKHEFLTGVAEGRYKIPQVVTEAAREAAMKGDWNDELATPGLQGMLNRTPTMGVPDKFDIGGGVEINRNEIMTPEEMNANKVANALAMIKPKVAEHTQIKAIDEASQGRLLDKQFTQQNVNREDTQSFTAEQNEANRKARKEEAELRLKAQEIENRLNRQSHWNIAAMQQEGAKERAQMGIDAKNLTDSSDVNDYVENNVANGLTTKERIAGLAKPLREAIYLNAAKKHYAIHDEKQQNTLNDLSVLNKIADKVQRLSNQIGNGAEITAATGGLTELGKELKALEIYKPVLAKLTSVKGTQSDQDTKIAGGNLVETWGLGVAAENKRRYNALLEMQADLFLEQFPEGTNLNQIEKAAKRYNINPKALKLVHERDEKRKLEGKK